MQRGRANVLRRIYLFQFLADFLPITGLYTVLFSDRGLSTLEISILIAAWSAASLLTEVPSGVLADRIDRRFVLSAGTFCTSIGFLIWLLFPGFWGFLIGFVVWGIGGAFYSGTFQALVYDELESQGKADKYLEVIGRAEAIYLIAIVTSTVLAAALIKVGFALVLVVSIVVSATAALISLSLPKAPPKKEVEDERYFQMLRRGLSGVVRSAWLTRFVMMVCVTGMSLDLLGEYAPLFILDEGFQPEAIALLVAVLVLAMAVVSIFANMIHLDGLRLPLALSATGLTLFVGTSLSGFAAIACYGLASVIAQLAYVQASAQLQHAISSDLRATITSVSGFGQEALNVVGLVAFGVLADAQIRSTAFEVLGLVIVGLGLVMFIRPKAAPTNA